MAISDCTFLPSPSLDFCHPLSTDPCPRQPLCPSLPVRPPFAPGVQSPHHNNLAARRRHCLILRLQQPRRLQAQGRPLLPHNMGSEQARAHAFLARCHGDEHLLAHLAGDAGRVHLAPVLCQRALCHLCRQRGIALHHCTTCPRSDPHSQLLRAC